MKPQVVGAALSAHQKWSWSDGYQNPTKIIFIWWNFWNWWIIILSCHHISQQKRLNLWKRGVIRAVVSSAFVVPVKMWSWHKRSQSLNPQKEQIQNMHTLTVQWNKMRNHQIIIHCAAQFPHVCKSFEHFLRIKYSQITFFLIGKRHYSCTNFHSPRCHILEIFIKDY